VRELEEVLQFPGNLQPMPGWLNSSKGSKQRSPVSPKYTRSLTKSQNDMADQLQILIDKKIAARNRIWQWNPR
jgi:hypothetical protein